ncbi:MAG: hypothetical protein WBN92_08065 [Terriglobia bacterium]
MKSDKSKSWFLAIGLGLCIALLPRAVLPSRFAVSALGCAAFYLVTPALFIWFHLLVLGLRHRGIDGTYGSALSLGISFWGMYVLILLNWLIYSAAIFLVIQGIRKLRGFNKPKLAMSKDA